VSAPIVAKPSPAPVEQPVPGVRLHDLWSLGDVHVLPLGQPARVVFALSFNALTVAIIAFVICLVLVFALGHAVGKRSTANPPIPTGVQTPEKKAETPAKTVETTKGGEGTKTAKKAVVEVYYCVQVLALPDIPGSRTKLDTMKKFLDAKGIPNLAIRTSRRTAQVSLFAGGFGRDQKADAETLTNRIKAIDYMAKPEFKDAKVVTTE
jgi:hypothetical protein